MPIAKDTPGRLPPQSDGGTGVLVTLAIIGGILVGGSLYPPVLILVAAALLLVLVPLGVWLPCRFARQAYRENFLDGGFLSQWRPSSREAMRFVAWTLLKWSPFALIAVIAFAGNNLVVDWIQQKLQEGIMYFRGSALDTGEALSSWTVWWVPDSFLEYVHSAGTELLDFGQVLAHFLLVLDFFFEIETYLSIGFLLWLSLRTVLYVGARGLLAHEDVTKEKHRLPITFRSPNEPSTGAVEPSLVDRIIVHRDPFETSKLGVVYARRGTGGPERSSNYRIPQSSSCLVRRLLTGTFLMNRYDLGCAVDRWRFAAPYQVIVVDLKGETLCFRMKSLVFFEAGLKLHTKINTQVAWMCLDSPFIASVSGFGRIAFRVNGNPAIVTQDSTKAATDSVQILRLIAWSDDSRFILRPVGGFINMALFAPISAEVEASAMVITESSDTDGGSEISIFSRVLSLVLT